MTNKISILIIVVSMCLVSVMAYPGTTTTFTDGTNTGNVTFVTGGSTNKYINLAIGSNVINAYMYLNGYEYFNSSGVIADFETGTVQGFTSDSVSTVAVATTSDAGGGSGSYVLNITTSYLYTTNKSINEQNYNRVNISFYYASADDGFHFYIGSPDSGTALDGAYDILVNNGGQTYAYNTEGGQGTSTAICSDAGWHKLTIDITNTGTGQADYYCDDVKRVAGWKPISNIPNNVTRMKFSSGRMYLDEITWNVTGSSSLGYPHNVTLDVNGVEAFNYGKTNNSQLDHKVFVNLTPYLSSITTYPTTITFKSNTSGYVEYSGLYVEDDVRNFTFNFYDESNASIFALNSTNTTLTIKCPDSQYTYPMTSGTYKLGLTCEDYELIKVTVKQEGSEYYRTATISPDEGTTPLIDWYLVDLRDYTVIQIVLKLHDLTGYRWADSTARLSHSVNNVSDATIIEQMFDVDDRVYLYLLQGQQYKLTITNAYGETWESSFIADTAEEKDVFLPGQGVYGDWIYLEDEIRYTFDFDADVHGFNLSYQDIGNRTSYVSFTIKNATDNSIIYQDTDSSGDYVVPITFTYQNAVIRRNESYIGMLYFVHDTLGQRRVEQTFGEYGNVEVSGWSTTTYESMLKWFIYVFLVAFILLFSGTNSHIGLVLTFGIMIIFKSIGWLDWINALILSLIGVIAFINWYRKEEVSPG